MMTCSVDKKKVTLIKVLTFRFSFKTLKLFESGFSPFEIAVCGGTIWEVTVTSKLKGILKKYLFITKANKSLEHNIVSMLEHVSSQWVWRCLHLLFDK